MYLLRLTFNTLTFVCLFVCSFSQRISSGPSIASRGTEENVLDRFLVREMLDSIYVEIERHTALASLIWVPLQASNWTAEVLDCRGVLLDCAGSA